MPKILPVIHHVNAETTLLEAQLARSAGADGVFLISHSGADIDLLELGAVIKGRNPGWFVGVNMLAHGCLEAHASALEFGLDAVWADRAGVTSEGLDPLGHAMQARINQRGTGEAPVVFGSVAFKYMPHEPAPELAALNGLNAGMIPTTSGPATGKAPSIEKVALMSKATGGVLAVASGMSCENVAIFAPHVSHMLVSTLVSLDAHHFDVRLLERFCRLARQ